MCSTHYSCRVLMKLEFFRRIFEKCSNIKFNENPSSWSRVVPCGQTDGETDLAKLIVLIAILRRCLKSEYFVDNLLNLKHFYSIIYACICCTFSFVDSHFEPSGTQRK